MRRHVMRWGSLRRLAAGLAGSTLALGATLPAEATQPVSAPIERPGVEADLQTRLDAIVDAGAIGATASVTGPGIRWFSAAGSAWRGGRPAWSGDAARIGSVTKTMVAAAALQLVQEGRWSLETSLAEVLPGVWPGRGGVTLRQMLGHTSGAPEFVGPVIAEATDVPTLLAVLQRRYGDRDLLDLAKGEEWLFEPGSAWSYSNTNYLLLGMMLRRESGQPLTRVLRERIFDPAGMPTARYARAPWWYQPHLSGYALFPGSEPVSLELTSPTIFAAAGAVTATMTDLDRFHAALSDGTLLKPRWLRQMRRPVAVEGNDVGYGLGTYRIKDPCSPASRPWYLYGHDGATFGTQTLSFATAQGGRRVSLVWTGRDLDPEQTPSTTPAEFFGAALAATCPGAARPTGPRPEVDLRSQRLASLG